MAQTTKRTERKKFDDDEQQHRAVRKNHSKLQPLDENDVGLYDDEHPYAEYIEYARKK